MINLSPIWSEKSEWAEAGVSVSVKKTYCKYQKKIRLNSVLNRTILEITKVNRDISGEIEKDQLIRFGQTKLGLACYVLWLVGQKI